MRGPWDSLSLSLQPRNQAVGVRFHVLLVTLGGAMLMLQVAGLGVRRPGIK